uniref:Putative aquaporin major intrinsic protein family n=2 Tax=Ixodes ricinus TaxID=34613 RepID=V5IBT7_IXORI
MILVLIGDSILAVIIAGDNEKLAPIVGPVGWGTAYSFVCRFTIAGGCQLSPEPRSDAGAGLDQEVPDQQGAAVTSRCSTWEPSSVPHSSTCSTTTRLPKLSNGRKYRTRIQRERTGQRRRIFATYPRDHVSTLTCFFDQLVGTGILMPTAEAITDPRNFGGMPKHLHPLALGLMIMALIFGFSYNCMAPLNPARDIGPHGYSPPSPDGAPKSSHIETGTTVWGAPSFWTAPRSHHRRRGSYKVGIGDNFPDDEPKLNGDLEGGKVVELQEAAYRPIDEKLNLEAHTNEALKL